MTSNNLLKFLGNREYLHQISYQELKSMVIQYPYSLSLRYLLAMKSQQEDNTDLNRNIELLATYGIDRAHLHGIFSEDPIILEDLEESVVMGEDFLELKELSTLERTIDETSFIQPSGEINFLQESIPSQTVEDAPNLSTPEPIDSPPAIIPDNIIEKNISELSDDTEVSNLIEQDLIEKQEIEVSLSPIPLPTEEIVGNPIAENELKPSESFDLQDKEFDENGLPLDAVEVNDYMPEEQPISNLEEEENKVEEISTIVEEEAVSDSDSSVYIQNPEEILDIESKVALNLAKAAEQEVTEEVDAEEDFPELETNVEASTMDVEAMDLPKPQIPFEVSFSEEDPTFLEAATEAVNPSEEKKPIKEVIPEEKPKPTVNQTAFQFDSLNQLEAQLSKTMQPLPAAPTPKKVFKSWKTQTFESQPLTGLSSFALTTNTRKVFKKKKRIVRKKFEKTVAFAEKSLKKDEQIASETLAKLLEEQGHYDQAITMYKELCLIIPKKSTYFAGEIERIQNLPEMDS